MIDLNSIPLTIDSKTISLSKEESIPKNYTGEWIKRSEEHNFYSICDYKNGKKHGKEIIYNKNKNLWNITEFNEGELNGEYLEFDTISGKLLIKENYKNNKKNGSCIYYNTNGFIEEEKNYLNDIFHGKSIFYYENSEIKRMETNYSIGLKEGTEYEWYEDGKIQTYSKYEKNILISNKKYFENENIKSIEKYNFKGEKEGTFKYYKEDGVMFQTSKYKEGILLEEIFFDINNVKTETKLIKTIDLSKKYKEKHIEGYYINNVYNKNKIKIQEFETLSIFLKQQDITDIYGHGKNIEYFEDGKIKSKEYYYYDMIAGDAFYYYPSGNLKKMVHYENQEIEYEKLFKDGEYEENIYRENEIKNKLKEKTKLFQENNEEFNFGF